MRDWESLTISNHHLIRSRIGHGLLHHAQIKGKMMIGIRIQISGRISNWGGSGNDGSRWGWVWKIRISGVGYSVEISRLLRRRLITEVGLVVTNKCNMTPFCINLTLWFGVSPRGIIRPGTPMVWQWWSRKETCSGISELIWRLCLVEWWWLFWNCSWGRIKGLRWGRLRCFSLRLQISSICLDII